MLPEDKHESLMLPEDKHDILLSLNRVEGLCEPFKKMCIKLFVKYILCLKLYLSLRPPLFMPTLFKEENSSLCFKE